MSLLERVTNVDENRADWKKRDQMGEPWTYSRESQPEREGEAGWRGITEGIMGDTESM